jgi:hypothetical protein
MPFSADDLDIFCIEDAVWVAARPVGVPVYDFKFETFFACRHAVLERKESVAVGRFGAAEDYDALYHELANRGVQLIHSPEQHALCSELPRWYERLSHLTPRSAWFPKPPPPADVERNFGWPVFIKGSRQTSRHNARLSIARNASEYEAAISAYATDHILHWQDMVIREFVPLRPVEADMGERIPASFEFRTFWWQGRLVGAGPYFSEFARYTWNKAEEKAALDLAEKAARLVNLPFVVVDVAQTADGRWIVIEINDGQESGYAGVPPIALWQAVIDLCQEGSD